ASGSFPVTIDTPAGRITIPKRPTRVISLSPTATEDLFAIGAGHQVIAVDDESDYPASAPRTSLSGYTPNVEAIARYRPDLVVISSDPALVSSLGKLAIPVLYEPAAANLPGAYGEILQIGEATGQEGHSGALVASMRAEVARLVASAPQFAEPPSFFYELSADPYYSATSSTFIGSVLGLFHLRDIANAAKDAGSGYPELSEEYILEADPQIIFLADTGAGNGGQTPATVAARPGWSGTAAVAHHDVVALDADIASRWGPRIVDLIALVEKALWTYKHHTAK
ncbi:MAG TPA: ABC transporter substrate-binding protein, partial [Acidimicrobiales bacterium]|nr:ABC transporter substrate-binding protein [Acidimicrobiales bacterium]